METEEDYWIRKYAALREALRDILDLEKDQTEDLEDLFYRSTEIAREALECTSS